jgi:hypothetical protein
MNIRNAVQLLAEDATVTQELFEEIERIARRTVQDSEQLGRTEAAVSDDLIHDRAGDFVVALSKKEISGVIKSVSDLNREFKRWLTRRNSPEHSELWNAVSEALLTLEKEGAVCRAPSHAKYNNSNATPWSLCEHAGQTSCPVDDTAAAAAKPKLAAKGEKNRVLTLSEARAFALNLLALYQGEVAMSELVGRMAECLPMFDANTSLNAKVAPESDGNDTLQDRTEDAQWFGDYDFLVREEAQSATESVWEGAGAIDRGKPPNTIRGRSVLCGYFLPKEVFGRKVKLESLGPSSTVQDIVKDLRRLMATCLPKSGNDRLGKWLASRIIGAILENLSRKCSENGFSCPLYSNNASNDAINSRCPNNTQGTQP